jgi:hypothetical protein
VTSLAASTNDSPRARTFAYPISRWYVMPVTYRIASWLMGTRVQPNHVTILGAVFGLGAVVVLLAEPTAGLGGCHAHSGRLDS